MNIFSPFLIFPLRKFAAFRDYVYYKLVDRSINFFDVSIGNEELRITGMQPFKLDSSTESGLIYPIILNRDFIANQSINHGRPQVVGTNTYSLSVLTFLRAHSANTLNTIVSASFINSSGFMRYVQSNQPRFDSSQLVGNKIDYGTASSLLIEPERSNIAHHSTNFSSTSAPNSNVVFVSPYSILAPDRSTLSSIVSTNLNTSAILYLTGCNNAVINKRYTISFFIRAPFGATQFSFRQHPLHQGSTINFTFERLVGVDELDRVVITSRSNPTDKVNVEKYGPDFSIINNCWYRVWYTTVANANNARIWPGISVYAGERRFYIWGLQIEEGDTPSSYIPVNGFIGVRGADTLSLSGTNLWSIYSSTPISNVTPNSATIYIESRKRYLSESPQTLLQFTNKNLATYNTIIYTTNSTNISSNLFNTDLLLNVIDPWVNKDVKSAFSYNNISNVIVLASNGRTTTGSSTQGVQLSGIQFGSNYTGHIKKLFVFPESISTGDLQILTT